MHNSGHYHVLAIAPILYTLMDTICSRARQCAHILGDNKGPKSRIVGYFQSNHVGMSLAKASACTLFRRGIAMPARNRIPQITRRLLVASLAAGAVAIASQ